MNHREAKQHKNQFFGLTYWLFFSPLCYRCLSLIILRHKVQIVLGSQLILEIHPLEAYTIAWTFGRLRETNVPLSVKTDTFTSWKHVFNKLKKKQLQKRTWFFKKGTHFLEDKKKPKNCLVTTFCRPAVLVSTLQLITSESEDNTKIEKGKKKQKTPLSWSASFNQYKDTHHPLHLWTTALALQSESSPALKEQLIRHRSRRLKNKLSQGFQALFAGVPHFSGPLHRAAPGSQIAGLLDCN